MGIFKRISDILSANLNDLTEGFEDPEKMLRQAIREMEESIASATQETAKALANEKVLSKELENNRIQGQKWQSRAEQAVESGDDELAKKALKRKNEHDKLVTALEDQMDSANSATQSLRRQLDGMKAKLSEAKRNLATLSARQRAADFRKKMQTVGSEFQSELDDDAFAKFDRLKSRVEQAEAEAEAMAELSGKPEPDFDLEEEFASDESAEVDAQLAEMKKKKK